MKGLSLSDVTEIDLGCGNDQGRVRELGKRGHKILGVDIDVSPDNTASLNIEVLIRFADVLRDQNLFNLSVYPFYPEPENGALKRSEMAVFIAEKLKEAASGDMHEALFLERVGDLLGVVEARPDFYEKQVFTAPTPRLDGSLDSHIIEADALDVLVQTRDDSLERIYADYFFNNAAAKADSLIAICRNKLSSTGVMEIVSGREWIQDFLPVARENGFGMAEAPYLLPRETQAFGQLALRTQGFLTYCDSEEEGWKVALNRL